jgi:hypothetical protein
MLRDRYDPMKLFDLVPALGLELEPVLLRLDTLPQDDTLFQCPACAVCSQPISPN